MPLIIYLNVLERSILILQSRFFKCLKTISLPAGASPHLRQSLHPFSDTINNRFLSHLLEACWNASNLVSSLDRFGSGLKVGPGVPQGSVLGHLYCSFSSSSLSVRSC